MGPPSGGDPSTSSDSSSVASDERTDVDTPLGMSGVGDIKLAQLRQVQEMELREGVPEDDVAKEYQSKYRQSLDFLHAMLQNVPAEGDLETLIDENTTLHKEKEQWENEKHNYVRGKQAAVQELANQQNKFKQSREALQDMIKDLEKELDVMTKRYEDDKHEITEARKQAQKQDVANRLRCSVIKEKLQGQINSNEKLNTTLATRKEESNDLEAKVTSMQEANDALQTTVETHEKNAARLQEEVDMQKGVIVKHEGLFKQQTETIGKLQEKLKDLTEEHNQKKQDLDEANKTHFEEGSKFESKIQELENVNQKLTNDLAKCNEALTRAKREHGENERRVIVEQDKRVAEVQSDLATVRESLQDKLEQSEKAKEELQRQIEEEGKKRLDHVIATAKEENSQLRELAAELEAACKEKDVAYTKLMDEEAARIQEHETLFAGKAAIDEEVARLRDVISDKDSEINQSKADNKRDLADKDKDIDRLNAEIVRREQGVAKAREEVSKLKAHHEANVLRLKSEIGKLETRGRERETELQQTITEQSVQVSARVAELDRNKKEIYDLKNTKEMLDQKIKDMTQVELDLRGALDRTKENLASVTEDLKASNDQYRRTGDRLEEAKKDHQQKLDQERELHGAELQSSSKKIDAMKRKHHEEEERLRAVMLSWKSQAENYHKNREKRSDDAKSNLQMQIHTLDNEIQSLHDKIKLKQDEVEKAERDVEEYRERLKEWEKNSEQQMLDALERKAKEMKKLHEDEVKNIEMRNAGEVDRLRKTIADENELLKEVQLKIEEQATAHANKLSVLHKSHGGQIAEQLEQSELAKKTLETSLSEQVRKRGEEAERLEAELQKTRVARDKREMELVRELEEFKEKAATENQHMCMQLQGHGVDYVKLSEKNNELKQNLTNVRAQLQSSDEKLQDATVDFKEKLAKLANENTALETTCSQLRIAVDTARRQASSSKGHATASIMDKETEINTLRDKVEALQSDNLTLQSKLSEVGMMRQRVNETLKEVRAQHQQDVELLMDHEKKINTLEGERASLAADKMELDQDLHELREESKHVRSTLKNLQETLEHVKRKNTELASEKKSLDEELLHKQRLLEQASSPRRASYLGHGVIDKVDALRTKEKQYKELQAQYEKDITAARAEADALRLDAKHLQESLDVERGTAADLESVLSREQGLYSQLRSEYDALSSLELHLKKELDSARTVQREKETELQEAQCKIVVLEVQLGDEGVQSITKLTKLREEAEADAVEHRKRAAALGDEIKALQSKLREAQMGEKVKERVVVGTQWGTEVQRLELEVEQKSEEAISERSRAERLDAQVRSLQRVMARGRGEAGALRGVLNETDMRSMRVVEKTKELTEDNTKLKTELKTTVEGRTKLVEDGEQRVRDADRKYHALEEENWEVKKEVTRVKAAVRGLEKEKADVEQDLKRLEERNEVLGREVVGLRREKTEARGVIDLQRKEVSVLNERSDGFSSRESRALRMLEESEGRLASLRHSVVRSAADCEKAILEKRAIAEELEAASPSRRTRTRQEPSPPNSPHSLVSPYRTRLSESQLRDGLCTPKSPISPYNGVP